MDAQPSVKRRSWKRRITVSLLRIVVGAYLGLCLVLLAFQNYLIFPGAATQGTRLAIVEPAQDCSLVHLKADGGEVVALFGPALSVDGDVRADAKRRPTILYFYGNGMCMAECDQEFAELRRRGFNVMVPDFLGYGMSGGKPSEEGIYETADVCFNHLSKRKDVDARRIVPMGWSLGNAAAIHLAAERDVPCVVCVSCFTSMSEMARRMFPYVPTGMFLRYHFENEKKLRTVKTPIFLAHGTRDGIIPFDMSKELADAAGGRVTKFDVRGGDHNDVFDVGGVELMDAVEGFVNANAGKN